jgi:hypothetical protein
VSDKLFDGVFHSTILCATRSGYHASCQAYRVKGDPDALRVCYVSVRAPNRYLFGVHISLRQGIRVVEARGEHKRQLLFVVHVVEDIEHMDVRCALPGPISDMAAILVYGNGSLLSNQLEQEFDSNLLFFLNIRHFLFQRFCISIKTKLKLKIKSVGHFQSTCQDMTVFLNFFFKQKTIKTGSKYICLSWGII